LSTGLIKGSARPQQLDFFEAVIDEDRHSQSAKFVSMTSLHQM